MQKTKIPFKIRKNLSSALPPIIKKYVKILYSEGFTDNTVTHYRQNYYEYPHNNYILTIMCL